MKRSFHLSVIIATLLLSSWEQAANAARKSRPVCEQAFAPEATASAPRPAPEVLDELARLKTLVISSYENGQKAQARLLYQAFQAKHSEAIALGIDVSTLKTLVGDLELVFESAQLKENRVERTWGAKKTLKEKHDAPINKLALSPDGRRLATASNDGVVVIWDLANGTRIYSWEAHPTAIKSMQFSPDGSKFLTAGDWKVKIWNLATGEQLGHLMHDIAVESAAFSSDGMKVVTGTLGKAASIWDVASGDMLFNLLAHTEAVKSVKFSPNGQFVVSGSLDGRAIIWDVLKGRIVKELSNIAPVTSVAFSSDGSKILTTSTQQIATLWEAKSGKKLFDLGPQPGDLFSASLSPDGKFILTTGARGHAFLWNSQTGTMARDLSIEGAGPMYQSSFSKDSKTVLISTANKGALLYEVETGELLEVFVTDSPVRSVLLNPEGNLAVAGTDDKAARVWTAIDTKRVP